MELRKYGVYRTELPVQDISKRDGGRDIKVTGTEMHGAHRCIVLAVDPDGQFAVVCPLTSAQDSRGGEKWSVVKKSWLRINHLGKPTYVLTEQIRYVDALRFYEQEGELGQYDSDQFDLKLKALLGFI
jgi:mRNA-degrading endonuclease toxin of MazEF toxin-antitoxin module